MRILLVIAALALLSGCAEFNGFMARVNQGIQCNEPVEVNGVTPIRPSPSACRYWLSK